MSSVFAKIFQHAEKTFALVNKGEIRANISILKSLIDKLSLKDLEIDPYFASKESFRVKNSAPCTFINISDQSDRFTMSVFVINENYTMPLHDHPSMHGLLKVISGRLKIQSYTRLANDNTDDILVKPEPPQILDHKSSTTYLDENTCNYHEITALDGPAAFFDVLSPPYSGLDDQGPDSRHCHFYRKLMVDNSDAHKVIKLEQIECPDHYYCNSVKL